MRRRRAGDIAVEHDGNVLHARGDNGARHGGDLAPAKPAHQFQRIVEKGAMQGDRRLDRRDLAFQARLIDARAAADPVRRRRRRKARGK